MRFLKRVFGLTTKNAQNTSMIEPTSLVAFSQLSGTQQSMLAETLVANLKDRQALKRAS
ncbi:MAG: hypothetical protein ABI298_01830 [Acidimicrobiales bacterium]